MSGPHLHTALLPLSGRSLRFTIVLLTLAAGLTACGNRPAALGEATLQDIINTVEYGPEGGPLETARNGASVDVDASR